MSDSGITNLCSYNFDMYKSKIKRALRNRFGLYALKVLEIASKVRRPHTRYGIRIDKAKIDFVDCIRKLQSVYWLGLASLKNCKVAFGEIKLIPGHTEESTQSVVGQPPCEFALAALIHPIPNHFCGVNKYGPGSYEREEGHCEVVCLKLITDC